MNPYQQSVVLHLQTVYQAPQLIAGKLLLGSPISGDPSARVTIPSGVTVATALDGPLLLPQKPLATPRPRYGPSNVPNNADVLLGPPKFL
ncbi:MAG: hypothetical protein CM1200mP35_03360 [Chloroflexota bacterium]|nr:MAG: hypothetical protein CM1200mP35_03360 [Chloroflexota bacterium]